MQETNQDVNWENCTEGKNRNHVFSLYRAKIIEIVSCRLNTCNLEYLPWLGNYEMPGKTGPAPFPKFPPYARNIMIKKSKKQVIAGLCCPLLEVPGSGTNQTRMSED